MLATSDEEADLYDADQGGCVGIPVKRRRSKRSPMRRAVSGRDSPGLAVHGVEVAASCRGDVLKASEGAAADARPRLTDREMEVLKLVAPRPQQPRYRQGALHLENTVKNHIRDVLESCLAGMEAVVYAVREKIVKISSVGRLTATDPTSRPLGPSSTSPRFDAHDQRHVRRCLEPASCRRRHERRGGPGGSRRQQHALVAEHRPRCPRPEADRPSEFLTRVADAGELLAVSNSNRTTAVRCSTPT